MNSISRNFLVFSFLLFSTIGRTQTISKDSLYKAIDYFVEIAMGSEFGSSQDKVICKWEIPIKYYICGEKRDYLEKELKYIVKQLDTLTHKNLQIEQVFEQSKANLIVFFGSADEYVKKIEPGGKNYAQNNWGLFVTLWKQYSLYKGSIYVDVFRAKEINAQKHLLREEFTQALGLMNDSYKYEKSMFYQGWTTYTEYAIIDRLLIEMLYNPQIKPAMTVSRVCNILYRFYAKKFFLSEV